MVLLVTGVSEARCWLTVLGGGDLRMKMGDPGAQGTNLAAPREAHDEVLGEGGVQGEPLTHTEPVQ